MNSPSNANTINLAKDPLVIASSNTHKIEELRALLPDGIQLIGQDALGVVGPEETGCTFIENALLKARHAAAATGLPAIADDSGLVVTALNGAPGVKSARYASEDASDHDNCLKLLHALNNQSDRRASFHASLVFLTHADDPDPIIAQGRWPGEILSSPRGSEGFGYDPLFFIPHLRRSAAELSQQEKGSLSHRGQALTILIAALMERYPQ